MRSNPLRSQNRYLIDKGDRDSTLFSSMKEAIKVHFDLDQLKISESSINSHLIQKFEDLKSILENHPFTEDLTKLYNYKNLSPFQFVQRVREDSLFAYFKAKFRVSLMDSTFFEYKIKQLLGLKPGVSQDAFQTLQEEMIDRWSALLYQKIITWKLAIIEEQRAQIIKELSHKIEELNKIETYLDDSDDATGLLWNLDPGKWQISDFQILKSYKTLLQNDPSIRELIEILGKGGNNNKNKSHNYINRHPQITTFSKMKRREEIFSVKESDEFNYLINSELALLTDYDLQTLFYLKLVQQKLLTYDLIGNESVRITENAKEEIEISQYGPIIVCVDTSGSMKGIPEQIAKTLVYGICQLALDSKRPCHIISFSTDTSTFTINNITEIQHLVEFLTYSFNGGTSFTGPMREASKIIKGNSTFKHADILVVSDFVLASLDNYTTSTISKLKEQEVKLHSLVISTSANNSILRNFTHNWRYNPRKEPTLRELKID